MASGTRAHKRIDSESDEEPVIPKKVKVVKRKISSKSIGKDFFDFNDGFTKLVPTLSTVSDVVHVKKEVEKDTICITKEEEPQVDNLDSESDNGSITPPPAIFKGTDELKNVFTRLESLKNVQKSHKVTKDKGQDESVKISVIQKTWPETIVNDKTTNILFSKSVKTNESFHELLKALNLLLGQEVVLAFKNTRIYPSSTPKSLENLGFIDTIDCYLLSEFNNYQAYLSEKKLELLKDSEIIDETQVLEETLNIKIVDEFGTTLKLAAKETTLVDQILKKWSETYNKPLKTIKLKSQGEFITGSLKDADVEDGDVLEIFYI